LKNLGGCYHAIYSVTLKGKIDIEDFLGENYFENVARHFYPNVPEKY